MKIVLLSLWMVCFVLLIHVHGATRDSASPVIPLPADAAELYKYTAMPVSLETGMPGISFPIYEINTGKIKIPITLSYHASGIKVNQRSTWVGLGWSCLPGGMISRTIRGSEDEDPNYGWIFHHANIDTVTSITTYAGMLPWSQGSPDNEPDFFNYNLPGKSGRFIYSRESKSFVTIPYDPIKITLIPDPTNPSYYDMFQITDDDGTRYVFDEKLTAASDENGLVKHVVGFELTKIISNDGSDTVFLTYGAGTPGGDRAVEQVSSSTRMYRFNTASTESTTGDDATAFVPTDVTTSTTYPLNEHLQLQEITFRQGKVTFYAGTVRTDYTGNALDSIVVYRKEGDGSYSRVKKTSFNFDYFYDKLSPASFYDYRLKLLSFSHEDVNGAQPETYKFGYNPVTLPPTISYAADYWGFYNGATTNTTFTPAQLPVQTDLQKWGNIGVANRNPDSSYIMAGILDTISYPTTGYTTMQYEINKYKTTRPPTKDSTLASITVTGVGKSPAVQDSISFQTVSPLGASTYNATININFSAFSANPINVAQSVVLKDITTGTQVNLWSSDDYGGANQNNTAHTVTYSFASFTGHIYRIYALVQDVSTTSVKVSATIVVNDSTKLNKIGGGIRIASINAYNNDSTLQKREVYKYMSDEQGYGYMHTSPDELIYDSYFTMKTKKVISDPSGIECITKVGQKIYYVAGINYPTVDFQGATVIYPFVTKYEYGNGVPNGKTIFQYAIPNDYVVYGNPNTVNQRTTIDNSLYGEQLISQHTYRYNPSDASYTLLRQVNNTYNVYNVATEKAYAIWAATEFLSDYKVTSLCSATVDDFGLASYIVKSGRYCLTSTIEQNFDNNGNSLVNTTYYDYNGFTYPKKISRVNSKGDSVSQISYYPGEQATGDANNSVLNKLLYKNMIRSPFWQGNYVNGTLMSYKHTIFGDSWGTNDSLVAVKADSTGRFGNNSSVPPNVIVYQSYDKYGNIRQQTDDKGITSAYTWTTDGTYPVSQTMGASANQVLYDGFENANSWTGITSDATVSHTGRYAGLITNAASYTNTNWINAALTAATVYRYSGWVYSNGPSATINLLMKKSGETGSYTYIDYISTSTTGGWVYLEKTFSVPSDVVALSIRLDNGGTGKVWFDDIKLRPAAAQMSTYSFLPLVGMSSKSDEMNHTLYYEFDGQTRLKLIRDQDRNILKMYCYNYAGQADNCNGIVYYNDRQSKTYAKTCGTGGAGSVVEYVVDAGKYSSSVSVADANTRALAEITTSGQVYADKMGACTYYSDAQSQSFTKACTDSGVGSTVTYTVKDSAYTSSLTKADANSKAVAAMTAYGQAYADSLGYCTWSNDLMSAIATRACGTGYIGSDVTYTVNAGKYTSTVSKADANAKATADLNGNVQSNANTNGTCITCNVVFSKKSDSGDLGIFNVSIVNSSTGVSVYNHTYNSPSDNVLAACLVIPTGTYVITITGQNTLYATVNGTEKAITASTGQSWTLAPTLTVVLSSKAATVYTSAAYTSTFTKSNCTKDSTGSSVDYTVAAGAYTSTVSQAYVDSLAAAYAAANGPAYANANGFCFPSGTNVAIKLKTATSAPSGQYSIKFTTTSGVTLKSLTYLALDGNLPLYTTITSGACIVSISSVPSITVTVNGTTKTISANGTQTWTTSTPVSIIIGN